MRDEKTGYFKQRVGAKDFLGAAIMVALGLWYVWPAPPKEEALAEKIVQDKPWQPDLTRPAYTNEVSLAIVNSVQSVPLKSNWRRVAINKATNGNYSFSLYYSTRPRSVEEVTADTRTIGRAALKPIVDHGIVPTQDIAFIHVSAEQDGFVGESGTPQSVYFGYTYFDPSSDSFKFELAK